MQYKCSKIIWELETLRGSASLRWGSGFPRQVSVDFPETSSPVMRWAVDYHRDADAEENAEDAVVQDRWKEICTLLQQIGWLLYANKRTGFTLSRQKVATGAHKITGQARAATQLTPRGSISVRRADPRRPTTPVVEKIPECC